MNQTQCDTCALRKGSAANLELNNYLKALLCVLGPMPFYCHQDQDWKAPETHTRLTKAEFQARGFRVCAGWTAEVAKLRESGYYLNQPLVTKALAEMGVNELEAGTYAVVDSEDQSESLERLQRAIVMLSRKVMAFRPETLAICGLAKPFLPTEGS